MGRGGSGEGRGCAEAAPGCGTGWPVSGDRRQSTSSSGGEVERQVSSAEEAVRVQAESRNQTGSHRDLRSHHRCHYRTPRGSIFLLREQATRHDHC